MTANPLSRRAIAALLPGHPWADLLQIFDELPSTNTLAKELAAQGAPEGTVLLADRQSAGRGRLGRSFLSPGGVGIYLSVILRPNCPPEQLMHLTCAVGVALADAIEEVTGLRPGIKWINDLVVGRRKLGGILTELGFDAATSRVSHAVVGIGINCRQSAGDFDPAIRDLACSLSTATGRDWDRNLLVGAILRKLSDLSRELLVRPEQIMARYRADCITLNQPVQIIRDGIPVDTGIALDVDPSGGLVVRCASGAITTITSGEVSVRGLYGYL